MTNIPTPTPGFEFPAHLGDAVDAKLRSAFNDKPAPIISVRPERQPRIIQTSPLDEKPVIATPPQPTSPVAFGQHANTVPNVAPAPTPMTDPEAVSIDLPSNFAFYSFKDLYIRPFRVSHLAKLAKANTNASLQMMAEVVSSVLSTPTGETGIAFKLTMADFTAVLYWLRFNSFTKKTMQVEYRCNSKEHLDKIKSGELVDASRTVTSVANASMLETNELTAAPDREYFTLRFHTGETVGLKPETIQDVMEFLDHPLVQDEEFQYLAKLAALLDIPYTLAQKVEFVTNELSTDHTVTIQEFAKIADDYGVDEYVQLRCPVCAASQKVKLPVDAARFLSPKF